MTTGLQTECINAQNAPFNSYLFSAVSVSQTGACQRYLTMATGQNSSAIHCPLTTLTLKTHCHRRVTLRLLELRELHSHQNLTTEIGTERLEVVSVHTVECGHTCNGMKR